MKTTPNTNRKSWKKAAVVILIIGVAGFAAYRGVQIQRSRNPQAEEKQSRVPVLVQAVETGGIRNILFFNGDIRAREEVDVFPKVPGKLVENRVREGDRVQKGQVIALVDRDITGMKYEYSEVTSPIEGLIAKVYSDRGSGLNPPTMSVSMGTPIARVVNIERVKVIIHIPEAEIFQVTPGLQARIKVDTFPDRDFPGRVSVISPVVDTLTRTAWAEIQIPNPGHSLRPGMFARVSLVTAEKKDVVVIPIRSLIRADSANIVYVVKDDTARKRELALGIREGERVEVTSGLEAGENLVTTGQEMLTDGAEVVIVSE